MSGVPTAEHVTEIVRQFSVSYEVRAESMLLRDHTIRQVGFCLDLYGRDGVAHLSPGDERSKEIYQGLCEIASRIVAEEPVDCRYELGEFDSALRYGNSARDGGSVRLVIHIVHQNGFEQPVDPAETRALRELQGQLETLGVHQGGMRR